MGSFATQAELDEEADDEVLEAELDTDPVGVILDALRLNELEKP